MNGTTHVLSCPFCSSAGVPRLYSRRMPTGGEHYEFGRYRLDTTTDVLWRDGEVVPLTPKATALLRALVEGGGDLVTKPELMARVWPDTVVEEANLSVTISALRKVLDPREEGGSYILTVPRRGYRFAASVVAPKAPRMTLAVLPLRYLGSDDGGHLGLGMADALIGRLTGLDNLIVRSTGAVLRYAAASKSPREAGRELGVDAVLDGTVQRHGDRLRISVQLVPLRTDVSPWAQSFDEDFTDIFEVQDAVADKVAHALLPKLDPDAPAQLRRGYMPKLPAYEAYLRGRYFWSRLSAENVQRAFTSFHESTELDEQYALPHAGLADAYLTLGFSGFLEPSEAWGLARASAEQALELDDSVAEAHVALGFVKLFQDWDWKGARVAIERGVELTPNSSVSRQWHALLLAISGDAAGARREIARSRALDPLALIATNLAAFIHSLVHEHEQELELCRSAAELEPGVFLPHWSLGIAYVHDGRYDEAIGAHRRAVELAQEAPFMKAVLAWTLAMAGRTEEARSLKGELEEGGLARLSSYQLATLELALQDRESAVARLQQACDERDPWVVLLKIDPMLDALRDLPQFRVLVERVHGS